VQPPPIEPRAGQRQRQGDVGAGPTCEPQAEARAMVEELHWHFERVLQVVPEAIWAHIQDKEVME
jgi:hypothetical protein